jgi:hypothetical protein
MERCSCDFEARRKEARKIHESSRDIDEFIINLGNRCNQLIRDGNILYCIKTHGCDCGWVRATKTPVSSTYCHCAKGYIVKYFEAAFQRPVKVECLRRSKLSESYRDCLSTNCRIQCLGELPRKEKDPGDRFPRSQNTSWSLYHVTRAHGIGIVTFSGDGDGNHLLPSLHGGAEALR